MGKFFPILVLVLGSAYYFASQDNYDPKTIAGKRVLVTGASSGIGEALAYHYSELGARLVLTARRADLLDKVVKRCRQLGAMEVSVVPADMGNAKDRIKVVTHTVKQLAGLDHLILNHALIRLDPWRSTPENVTHLETVLNVNFLSYVDLTSLLMPQLLASKGNIGVVSSVGGKVGMPLSTTYCASKFAMQGFYSAFRQELNKKETGVTVTIAVLGAVNTEAVAQVVSKVTPSLDFDRIAETPQDTAHAIVRAVETGVYELYFGWMARALVTLHKIIPDTYENVVGQNYLSEYTL